MNIPKLRFKEFTDEWKHYSLDDIISISSKKYNPLTSNISYPCIELESILSNSGTVINTFDSLNQKSIKNVFKENDILFGKLRPYLKKYWYAKFNGVCSSEIWVLNNKLGLNKYLYYLIQTNKFNLIANNSTGSKMPRADWQFIKSQKFYISNMLEQEKIANFLTTVDKKITNLENTITSLENQKKGLLQQIFSQKLRFKDENNNNYPNWENKKITDIAITYIGLVTTMTKFYVEKGIPLIRNSDIKENKFIFNEQIFLDEKFAKNNSSRQHKLNDIITVHTGDVGTSAMINENLVNSIGFATIVTRIKDFNKYNPKYICWYLNSPICKSKIYTMITGDGRNNLNMKDFNKLYIPIPCLEEQTKIADFLSEFDRKLDNQKAQLEHWQQIKKGLLQQMFV